MTLCMGQVLSDTDPWDRDSDVAHPDDFLRDEDWRWVGFEYRRAS